MANINKSVMDDDCNESAVKASAQNFKNSAEKCTEYSIKSKDAKGKEAC